MSGNGRYIAYQSAATNLLGAGDTNQKLDIFVFDRQRRVTHRVSTNDNLVEADDHSQNPAMSLSGRFVVFESFADNLAGGNPGTPLVPISDIFLHDRDTDGDGVFDERGGIGTQLRQRQQVPAEPHQPQHRTVNHLRRPLRRVRDGGRQRQGGQDLQLAGFQPRPRHLFIWDRQLGTVTRRLREDGQGELPGASGAPIISGNGNLLLFRTQAVNSGGPSAPGRTVASAVVDTAVSGDGKSTTGEVPSPTTDTPPPADVPPPPPTGSTEDPATSGDGNTTGNTTEPDPGTGEAEPVVEVEELPEDEDGTPSIGALFPWSRRPRVGGNDVEIPGRELPAGRPDDGALERRVDSLHLRQQRARPRHRATVADGLRRAGQRPRRGQPRGQQRGRVPLRRRPGCTPTITSLNPANPSGPVTGGTQVIIAGSGFSGPQRPVRCPGRHHHECRTPTRSR